MVGYISNYTIIINVLKTHEKKMQKIWTRMLRFEPGTNNITKCHVKDSAINILFFKGVK